MKWKIKSCGGNGIPLAKLHGAGKMKVKSQIISFSRFISNHIDTFDLARGL